MKESIRKERPWERIGLTSIYLINPLVDFDENEIFMKNNHLSVTSVGKDGNEKETSIMISLDELGKDGIDIKIFEALLKFGKSYGYISQYLINVAKIKTENVR